MSVIELSNVNVTFQQKSRSIVAVQNESLTIEQGDIYGIVGYSGAGKSTLVRTINYLQAPTSGSVLINGVELGTLSATQLRIQRQKIGMIFQHFNLMDELTVYGNVALPLKHSNLTKQAKDAKIKSLLELVGLADRIENYPSQLSGGQKQRVAIARALANDPEILISDEATSALDPRTTNQILDLLKELNQKLNLTIVLITHEMQAIKKIANKVAVMENGTIIERGSLLEIFTRPTQKLTRDFINTATNRDEALQNVRGLLVTSPLKQHDQLVELQYVGNETAQPVLATIYADFQVMTNILYSNMEILSQTPIGTIIAVMSGEPAQISAAKSSLIDHDVRLNVLEEGK